MSLVENERIKLLATLFNNCGVGALVAGVIAPTFVLISSNDAKVIALVAAQCFWFAIAIVLHLLARSVLGRLKE